MDHYGMRRRLPTGGSATATGLNSGALTLALFASGTWSSFRATDPFTSQRRMSKKAVSVLPSPLRKDLICLFIGGNTAPASGRAATLGPQQPNRSDGAEKRESPSSV